MQSLELACNEAICEAKRDEINFTKIFCEKYLEKIEIVGTGNDGNSDFDVLDAIGKIEFPNDVRIKV